MPDATQLDSTQPCQLNQVQLRRALCSWLFSEESNKNCGKITMSLSQYPGGPRNDNYLKNTQTTIYGYHAGQSVFVGTHG